MRQIRFAGRHVVGFGVGENSDDLTALIKTSDAQMQQLTDSFNQFASKWISADTAAYNNFLADYTSLLSRYAIAKNMATTALAAGFWSETATNINAAYTALTKANGDWALLWGRLQDAQKAASSNMPSGMIPDAAQSVSNDATATPALVPEPPAVSSQSKPQPQPKQSASAPSTPPPVDNKKPPVDDKKPPPDEGISTGTLVAGGIAAVALIAIIAASAR